MNSTPSKSILHAAKPSQMLYNAKMKASSSFNQKLKMLQKATKKRSCNL
jgi:hypothetical protein